MADARQRADEEEKAASAQHQELAKRQKGLSHSLYRYSVLSFRGLTELTAKEKALAQVKATLAAAATKTKALRAAVSESEAKLKTLRIELVCAGLVAAASLASG